MEKDFSNRLDKRNYFLKWESTDIGLETSASPTEDVREHKTKYKKYTKQNTKNKKWDRLFVFFCKFFVRSSTRSHFYFYFLFFFCKLFVEVQRSERILRSSGKRKITRQYSTRASKPLTSVLSLIRLVLEIVFFFW